MRIGVYIGSWPLTQLGGVGVYLRELLGGLPDAPSRDSITLIVDRCNERTIDELGWHGDVRWLDRPRIESLGPLERRRVIQIRRRSYESVERADLHRCERWSHAARAYLWGLDDVLAADGIDLLYCPLPPYLKKPIVPTLVAIHDLKHLHRPQDHSPADLARRRRWKRIVKAASAVICSYDSVRQDVIARLGVPAEQVQVVRNAVPPDFVRPRGPRSGIRAASPVDAQHPGGFALMPAQFWPHKNHEGVLRAMARLRDRHQTSIPVVFTGQNQGECAAHAHAMAALADQLGIGHLATQAGFVSHDELLSLYDAARFILAPTHYDPGSFPVYQALALSKPLIASRIESIPATVGDAGLLVDPGNVDEIAIAMKRIWTDGALAAALGSRGPGRVSPRTWRDVAGDWLGLCHQISRNHAALR